MNAPTTAPLSPPALLGLFSNLSREHGFEPVHVDGALPDGLRGTLYRNGVASSSNSDAATTTSSRATARSARSGLPMAKPSRQRVWSKAPVWWKSVRRDAT